MNKQNASHDFVVKTFGIKYIVYIEEKGAFKANGRWVTIISLHDNVDDAKKEVEELSKKFPKYKFNWINNSQILSF